MAAVPFIVGLAFVAGFTYQAQAATGNCTSANVPMCDSTCSIRGWCTEDKSWVEGAPCPAGQVCSDTGDPSKPGCTTDPAASSCNSAPKGKIFCLQAGTFPSLTDCTIYFTCDDDNLYTKNEIPTSCPYGKIFDSCSKTCVDGTCSTSATTTVICTGKNSYIGVDPKNNNLYYKCSTNQTEPNIYPYWQSCPTGQVYSVVSKKCVAIDSCTPCPTIGSLAITGTTCSYAYCYGPGNFEVRNCLTGYHYDTKARTCISGACS